MTDKKDRKIRATVEFDITVPGHEKDERKFIERCFIGTRCTIVEIKKAEEEKTP